MRHQPRRVTADRLTEPWLFDTEYLLGELARIRELALRVPPRLEAVGPINSVIDACWDLEQRLRYMLQLHRDADRALEKAISNRNRMVKSNGSNPERHQSAEVDRVGRGVPRRKRGPLALTLSVIE